MKNAKLTKNSVEITNNTKGKLPSLPFDMIRDKILGKNYELSIAIVGDKVSKDLNFKYRNINKPTNVLSFNVTENSGELIFNLKKVIADAPKFDMNFKNFFGFLVIHGTLHLKGYEHSDIMDKLEKKWTNYFNYDKKYPNRNRHR